MKITSVPFYLGKTQTLENSQISSDSDRHDYHIKKIMKKIVYVDHMIEIK